MCMVSGLIFWTVQLAELGVAYVANELIHAIYSVIKIDYKLGK